MGMKTWLKAVVMLMKKQSVFFCLYVFHAIYTFGFAVPSALNTTHYCTSTNPTSNPYSLFLSIYPLSLLFVFLTSRVLKEVDDYHDNICNSSSEASPSPYRSSESRSLKVAISLALFLCITLSQLLWAFHLTGLCIIWWRIATGN
ncbi:uncharacterized protein LOC132803903 [Ziziphus jujuba]|uniref:Uncharacterized protein LOC132803902 n=1 Tax=Ziziphus jujuba TaxID=326968 RepID=A0ABM4AAE1_ZIZJJ|nr:uncharacterized protein LOC132803902 [Ziziphus jujuba]XP_060673698.1 uncharacterized protein LOC132803903 [Ziziphus jujuba]